jgi:Xaa-Pro aminopeptidase
LAAKDIALVALEPNPIDGIWLDRPAPPKAPAHIQAAGFSGEGSSEKRDRMAKELVCQEADAAVLTKPDSLAWLLNVRGGDVPHTPLVLSFGLLREDGGLDWFVDSDKISADLRDHLGNAVVLREPQDLAPALDELGASKHRVLIDPEGAAHAIAARLQAGGAVLVEGRDPCALAKACKNPIEIEGTRTAHRRDGLAVTRFLAWLAREAGPRAKAGDPITELEAAEKLRALRSEDLQLKDLSFDTISAAGANAALAHYRVTEESNRALGLDEIYLCDSGGQYPDGTTDITRTIIVGAPTVEMKDRFTRVLKGHIALARARFPEGTTGGQLDSLARAPLWEIGCDYDHGTGHGVGAYLSVHEGPQRIAKAGSSEPLRPGMILSDEPGYYRADGYGIRIENLIVVKAAPDVTGDKPVLEFENLTWAPIDKTLIDAALLSESEIAWLNAYHRQVWDLYGDALEGVERDWLSAATAPLNT